MRRNAQRFAAGGLLLASMLGIVWGQEPPVVLPTPRPIAEPRRLKTELEALALEREAANLQLVEPSPLTAERAQLRSQLMDLLKKIAEKKTVPVAPRPATPVKSVTPPMPPPEKPKIVFDENQKPLDSLRLAQNLYRSGEIEAALMAFHQIDLNTLAKDDRAFVSYMSACYLRNQGKMSEAAVIFREIASAKDDPFLAESAVAQLALLKSRQELTTQIEQLRARRKTP